MASKPHRTISQRAVIGQNPDLVERAGQMPLPGSTPRLEPEMVESGRKWRGYSQKRNTCATGGNSHFDQGRMGRSSRLHCPVGLPPGVDPEIETVECRKIRTVL